jgi:hypothetical protein
MTCYHHQPAANAPPRSRCVVTDRKYSPSAFHLGKVTDLQPTAADPQATGMRYPESR